MPKVYPSSIHVKTCQGCGNEFYQTKANQSSFKNRKYRTHRCYSNNNRGDDNWKYKGQFYEHRLCIGCGKPIIFSRKVSYSQASGQKYCSATCYGQSARGVKNSRWKGGRFQYKDGYVLIRTDDGGELRAEHRVIAEKALGRRLKKSEKVHHVDGNKANNANHNLLICSNSYHKWLHEEIRLMARCRLPKGWPGFVTPEESGGISMRQRQAQEGLGAISFSVRFATTSIMGLL